MSCQPDHVLDWTIFLSKKSIYFKRIFAKNFVISKKNPVLAKNIFLKCDLIFFKVKKKINISPKFTKLVAERKNRYFFNLHIWKEH
jgi:hypothetical protein